MIWPFQGCGDVCGANGGDGERRGKATTAAASAVAESGGAAAPGEMRVKVLMFASARELANCGEYEARLPVGARASDLRAARRGAAFFFFSWIC